MPIDARIYRAGDSGKWCELANPERPELRELGRGFSKSEAADAVGMGVTSIETAIYSGELPAYRRGRRVIIWQRDLEVWAYAFEPVVAGKGDAA